MRQTLSKTGVRSDGEAAGDDVVGDHERLALSGDRSQELLAPQDLEDGVLDGHDGRRTGHVAEQPDLAEELAGSLSPQERARLRDLHEPRLDDVEAVGLLALAQD